jgi:hypothetical protein
MMFFMIHWPTRLKFALLVAMLAAAVGTAYRGPHGDLAVDSGMGALMMLGALTVASHRPKWTGGVLGLLGGMVAAALDRGWGHLPAWGGFIGAMVILAWAVVDEELPIHKGTDPNRVTF